MEKIIIAATDQENGIGAEGKLPWHYPKDLKHFKKKTVGYPVLMGRKTYQSLPEKHRPLPDRKNIVLTQSSPELDERVKISNSLEEAWKIASKFGEKVFIAGGESVYKQALPEADKLFLTRVPGTYGCDTFFPRLDKSLWNLRDSAQRGELLFEEYTRKT